MGGVAALGEEGEEGVPVPAEVGLGMGGADEPGGPRLVSDEGMVAKGPGLLERRTSRNDEPAAEWQNSSVALQDGAQ